MRVCACVSVSVSVSVCVLVERFFLEKGFCASALQDWPAAEKSCRAEAQKPVNHVIFLHKQLGEVMIAVIAELSFWKKDKKHIPVFP